MDEYLDFLETGARPMSLPTFRIALRGYDRRGVDRYIQELLARPTPSN